MSNIFGELTLKREKKETIVTVDSSGIHSFRFVSIVHPLKPQEEEESLAAFELVLFMLTPHLWDSAKHGRVKPPLSS